MNKLIDTWISNVQKYPPNEIFFQKYGKDAKAEKRLQDICDASIYSFNFNKNSNHLGDLRSAHWNLHTLYQLGFESIKPEQIKIYSDELLSAMKSIYQEVEELFKKDQILQKYYIEWKVKFSDLDKEMFNMTRQHLGK